MNDNQKKCGAIGVGDNGQRYEVRAVKVETGEDVVIGWTSAPDGGGLLTGTKIWPAMRDAYVVDRGAKP